MSQVLVKLCPGCGAENDEQAIFCDCGTSLLTVTPGLPGASVPAQSQVKVFFVNLDPDTYQPDGQELELPTTPGDYVIGRDLGQYQPGFNLKDWASHQGRPSFFQDNQGRHRCISRNQAIVTVQPSSILLTRSPQSTKMTVWPSGDSNQATILEEDMPNLLQNGDVILIGDPFKSPDVGAPGIIFRVFHRQV